MSFGGYREPPDDRRCTVVRPDGSRCKSWAIRGETICAGHAGRGAVADPVASQAKAMRKYREAKAQAEEEAAIRRLSLRQQIARTAELKREALVNRLFELALSTDDRVALQALEQIQSRLWGRPVAPVVEVRGTMSEEERLQVAGAMSGLTPEERMALVRQKLSLSSGEEQSNDV